MLLDINNRIDTEWLAGIICNNFDTDEFFFDKVMS